MNQLINPLPAEACPLVTVGIPIYRPEHNLAAVLAMVQAQTYPNLHIVICDDTASAANRAVVPDSGRISYHAQPVPQGSHAAFQQTLALAQGDYFVWATPQTLWEPGFVAELVALLTASPQAGLAFCHADISAGTGFIIRQHLNLQNLLPVDNHWLAAQKFIELNEDSGKPLFFYGLYRTHLLRGCGGAVDCPGEWWAAPCLTVFRALLVAPITVSPRLFFHYAVNPTSLLPDLYLCGGHFLAQAEAYLNGYHQVLTGSDLLPAIKSLLNMALDLRRLSFYAFWFKFNNTDEGQQLVRSILAQVTPPADGPASGSSFAPPAAEWSVAQAMTALRQSDYSAAIAGFEDALAVNPGLWQVYELLAALWVQQGQPHLAAAVFAQASAADCKAVEYLTSLSADPVVAGRIIQTAIDAFTERGLLPLAELLTAPAQPAPVAPPPSQVDELIQQTRLLRRQKEYPAAVEAIKSALALAPTHPEVLVLSGLLMLDAHDRDGVELVWQKLAGVPRETPGWADLVMGLVLAGSNKVDLADFLPVVEAVQADNCWEEAAMFLNIAQSRLPHTPAEKVDIFNRLGVCYVKLDNPDEAIIYFEKGLALDPDNLDIVANLAQLHYQREEYDQATGHLNHLLKLNPTDVPALLLLGDICIRLEVFDVALMAFEKVQVLAPQTEGVADLVALLKQ